MKGCLKFNDHVHLFETEPDQYGTEHIINESGFVPAIVELNTGYSHGNFSDAVTSDARVYLPPDLPFLQEKTWRLEESLAIIDMFGTKEEDSWYKVNRVEVFKDHQACNTLDHIVLNLKKTVQSPGCSIGCFEESECEPCNGS